MAYMNWAVFQQFNGGQKELVGLFPLEWYAEKTQTQLQNNSIPGYVFFHELLNAPIKIDLEET